MVKLLACVVILHFALLAYSPSGYSPGNKLERRNHHVALKLTSLQHWDLASSFLIFNHLWGHLRQMGRIFSKCLWVGGSYRLQGCWSRTVIPAPVILSFTAFARRDSGSKTPCPNNLLSSGPLKAIIALLSCHFGLILTMPAHRALILYATTEEWCCIGWAIKDNKS